MMVMFTRHKLSLPFTLEESQKLALLTRFGTDPDQKQTYGCGPGVAKLLDLDLEDSKIHASRIGCIQEKRALLLRSAVINNPKDFKLSRYSQREVNIYTLFDRAFDRDKGRKNTSLRATGKALLAAADSIPRYSSDTLIELISTLEKDNFLQKYLGMRALLQQSTADPRFDEGYIILPSFCLMKLEEAAIQHKIDLSLTARLKHFKAECSTLQFEKHGVGLISQPLPKDQAKKLFDKCQSHFYPEEISLLNLVESKNDPKESTYQINLQPQAPFREHFNESLKQPKKTPVSSMDSVGAWKYDKPVDFSSDREQISKVLKECKAKECLDGLNKLKFESTDPDFILYLKGILSEQGCVGEDWAKIREGLSLQLRIAGDLIIEDRIKELCKSYGQLTQAVCKVMTEYTGTKQSHEDSKKKEESERLPLIQWEDRFKNVEGALQGAISALSQCDEKYKLLSNPIIHRKLRNELQTILRPLVSHSNDAFAWPKFRERFDPSVRSLGDFNYYQYLTEKVSKNPKLQQDLNQTKDWVDLESVSLTPQQHQEELLKGAIKTHQEVAAGFNEICDQKRKNLGAWVAGGLMSGVLSISGKEGFFEDVYAEARNILSNIQLENVSLDDNPRWEASNLLENYLELRNLLAAEKDPLSEKSIRYGFCLRKLQEIGVECGIDLSVEACERFQKTKQKAKPEDKKNSYIPSGFFDEESVLKSFCKQFELQKTRCDANKILDFYKLVHYMQDESEAKTLTAEKLQKFMGKKLQKFPEGHSYSELRETLCTLTDKQLKKEIDGFDKMLEKFKGADFYKKFKALEDPRPPEKDFSKAVSIEAFYRENL
ncbi:MAG: hypothetical protein QM752_05720 [Gammaproteobacteria bacterium]